MLVHLPVLKFNRNFPSHWFRSILYLDLLDIFVENIASSILGKEYIIFNEINIETNRFLDLSYFLLTLSITAKVSINKYKILLSLFFIVKVINDLEENLPPPWFLGESR